MHADAIELEVLNMKFLTAACVALLVAPLSISIAQTQPTGKTLAATMDVFVFPSEGQNAEQQSKDEVGCYNWATSNTGSDPFELTQLQAAQAQDTENAKKNAAQAGQGRGAQGVVKGAAVGALIGEIGNDDASKGAAYGAAAGLIAGRRHGRAERQKAEADAEKYGEAKQAATGEQIENFKKAFSVCLEAKDYMVKY
jgi:hypothetical protein